MTTTSVLWRNVAHGPPLFTERNWTVEVIRSGDTERTCRDVSSDFRGDWNLGNLFLFCRLFLW